jgi:hypothetical protein
MGFKFYCVLLLEKRPQVPNTPITAPHILHLQNKGYQFQSNYDNNRGFDGRSPAISALCAHSVYWELLLLLGIVRLPFGQNRSNQMKSDRKTHTHNICGVSTYKELLFIFHQNRFLLNNPCAARAFNASLETPNVLSL